MRGMRRMMLLLLMTVVVVLITMEPVCRANILIA